MTSTHYRSPDQIIEIVTTNDDRRYPRHKAKMAMIKMRPQAHSRCRQQWGGVTLMLTFHEVRAILEAIKTCDPGFNFTISKAAINKPEYRKKKFQDWNRQRVAGRRSTWRA